MGYLRVLGPPLPIVYVSCVTYSFQVHTTLCTYPICRGEMAHQFKPVYCQLISIPNRFEGQPRTLHAQADNFTRRLARLPNLAL